MSEPTRGARTMEVVTRDLGFCTSCQKQGPVVAISFGVHTRHSMTVRLCDPCKHAMFSLCLAADL